MPSDRLLIWLKYNFIGDAVLATPLIQAVADAGIDADVWYEANKVNLFEGCPLPVVPRDSKKLLDSTRAMRQAGYGTVILIDRSFRSALGSYLAGVPRRIGHSTERRGFLLTDRVPYIRQYEGGSYADLGNVLGLQVQAWPPVLWITEAEKAKGRELLQGASIVIQPGSTNYYKAPRPSVFDAVIDAAEAQGKKVAVVGVKSEQEYADKLKSLHKTVNLIGKCLLRDTLGVLSQAEVFAAGDTGLVHAAVALGTRTVSAFGPEPYEMWGHFHEPHKVLMGGKDLSQLNVEEYVNAVLG